MFQYPDRGTGSVFRLGPVDLEITAGEMLAQDGVRERALYPDAMRQHFKSAVAAAR